MEGALVCQPSASPMLPVPSGEGVGAQGCLGGNDALLSDVSRLRRIGRRRLCQPPPLLGRCVRANIDDRHARPLSPDLAGHQALHRYATRLDQEGGAAGAGVLGVLVDTAHGGSDAEVLAQVSEGELQGGLHRPGVSALADHRTTELRRVHRPVLGAALCGLASPCKDEEGDGRNPTQLEHGVCSLPFEWDVFASEPLCSGSFRPAGGRRASRGTEASLSVHDIKQSSGRRAPQPTPRIGRVVVSAPLRPRWPGTRLPPPRVQARVEGESADLRGFLGSCDPFAPSARARSADEHDPERRPGEPAVVGHV